MYDYVIVGGGSAGCVLANRLSADPQNRVCLLEAGPDDATPLVNMPAGVIALIRSSVYNWSFWTAPVPHCGNRRMFWPRGRVLGGSSAINAMVAIRGHASDYDQWAALGNAGWSYRELLPMFKATEDYEPADGAALTPQEAEYHGRGGGLKVSRRRFDNPLSRAFLDAAQQAGHRPTDDFNGAQQEGCGMYRSYQTGGERCSNARAFLHEARLRPNLTVITDAQATRVLFEGKRAVGVRYQQAGHHHEVRAAREVVLAAGAIGSPHLLLLSGIGPADELRPHGVELVHELPGVGKNLQDHLDINVSVRDRSRTALSFHPRALWSNLKGLWQYWRRREGALTSNLAEAGVFLRSTPQEPVPDLQMHFVPLPYSSHGLDLRPLFREYAYTVLSCDLRPLSRGEVKLASGDPLAPPEIQPNYLAHERDLERLVIAVKKAREILAQPALAPHRGEELMPGAQVQTDAQLRDWIRAHAETVYHPVGTCKMGSDALAVVDAQLCVRGVQGLRVADASIMPTLVGGNTNGPATMIGEKAARLILEQAQSASPPLAAAA